MEFFNPSENQKRVLAKIYASPTPKVALEQISNDEKLVFSRNLLAQKGYISFDNQSAKLTTKGEELIRDENIIDDNGLTSDGKYYAGSDSEGDNEGGEIETPPPNYESLKHSNLLHYLYENFL